MISRSFAPLWVERAAFCQPLVGIVDRRKDVYHPSSEGEGKTRPPAKGSAFSLPTARDNISADWSISVCLRTTNHFLDFVAGFHRLDFYTRMFGRKYSKNLIRKCLSNGVYP